MMHFAYGRDLEPGDFSGVPYDKLFVDSGDSLQQFSELVTWGIRKGHSDVITVLRATDIPKKSKDLLKVGFGVDVRVHEKEPSDA